VKLTRAEHRILQMFLNLGQLTSAQIVEAIGHQVKYPREYLHRLRRKIMSEGMLIDTSNSCPATYRLRRTRPIRDRAAYMRDWKSARNRAERASVAVSLAAAAGSASDRKPSRPVASHRQTEPSQSRQRP